MELEEDGGSADAGSGAAADAAPTGGAGGTTEGEKETAEGEGSGPAALGEDLLEAYHVELYPLDPSDDYRPPEERLTRFLFDESTITAAALRAFAKVGVSVKSFIGQVARGRALNHYNWAAHDEMVTLEIEDRVPEVEVISKEFRMRFGVRAHTVNLRRAPEVSEEGGEAGPTGPKVQLSEQRKGIPAKLYTNKITAIAKIVSHETLTENLERAGIEPYNLHPLTQGPVGNHHRRDGDGSVGT